jgi:cytochrome c-type biogenesis protein
MYATPMIADIVQAGLTSWWAFALAFAAGVVSFASPCVFPLVPGYLSFVTGERAEGDRGVGSMLLFVAGFTVVFVAVFGFTDVFLRIVRGTAGRIVTGSVIALFGTLLLLYAFERGPIGLYAERRPFLGRVGGSAAGSVRPRPAWAFPLGMAFAAGWTPCIGPVLAAITALAAGQGSALRGAFLLVMYSLGLGLPFVLVGLGVKRFMGAFDFIQRNYRWIAGASGALMLAIGVLIATGLWARLIAPLLPIINGYQPPI